MTDHVWYIQVGFSPNYRFRTLGPFDTFAEARDAAAAERRAGWSTGRPEKRERDDDE